MTRKVFIKLLGLFLSLLVVEIAAMELVVPPLAEHAAGGAFHRLAVETLWSCLIALFIALPAAAWVAVRVAARLDRVALFAHRIADGDLGARLAQAGDDSLSPMEAALDRTAERLGERFTDLDNRRQELAAMLDSMQEAVVAITPEGLVSWSNAAMRRIAGNQIRAGRPLVHSVRDPEILACVRAALEHPPGSFQPDVRPSRASSLAPGRVFEIHAAPLPSGGALVVLHDVTAIEGAEKSRREFIANVSHELRTPLTSIQGYVETLIEDPHTRPEVTREFLGVILKNATRMNRLTEDLLALASIESPDYKLTLQPTRASDLLADAIESLGGIVVDSGVELQSAGATEAQVMADTDAMHQVFGNLIENSVKYAKAGKRIRAGAQLLESEVEFFVQDFGPGIASEHLDRIFERFYRIDKARSRESGGTGLGLAIVKHIVQAHGGRLWAESELGAGATFHFTLPLAPEAPETDEPGSVNAP